MAGSLVSALNLGRILWHESTFLLLGLHVPTQISDSVLACGPVLAFTVTRGPFCRVSWFQLGSCHCEWESWQAECDSGQAVPCFRVSVSLLIRRRRSGKRCTQAFSRILTIQNSNTFKAPQSVELKYFWPWFPGATCHPLPCHHQCLWLTVSAVPTSPGGWLSWLHSGCFLDGRATCISLLISPDMPPTWSLLAFFFFLPNSFLLPPPTSYSMSH